MADEEQLAILRRGPETWNAWREENPSIRPDLRGADLDGADLIGADLHNAKLGRVQLLGADLTEADLRGAFLIMANLLMAELHGANLNKAVLGETIFADADLSGCQGLESCVHHSPSTIDHRTLQRSWPLPLAFLRGVGLPDTLIDYLPSLLNQPIQFYSCLVRLAETGGNPR